MSPKGADAPGKVLPSSWVPMKVFTSAARSSEGPRIAGAAAGEAVEPSSNTIAAAQRKCIGVLVEGWIDPNRSYGNFRHLERSKPGGDMPYLRTLRRAAAAFRRLLSQHRDLFDALRRPDFRPERDDHVDKRFRAVADR